jgi:Holliday junction DNA helicase RuvA
LTAGGVGYEVHLAAGKMGNYKINDEVVFYTYLKVGENSMDLYGFENIAEKSFFELLLSVSGIGPKSAMNILNLGTIDNIKSAIARKDIKYLTAVQGMGQKTAERLVVELQKKVGAIENPTGANAGESQILADVIDGLVAMGYGKDEAKAAVEDMDIKGKNTEEVLRKALRVLGK